MTVTLSASLTTNEMVAGSTASLKVAVIGAVSRIPVAAFAGETAETVGGVVSAVVWLNRTSTQ
jgi:hypothetical protein